MKLEDFPTDLPRIPFKNKRLIVGPIYEFGEITPVIGALRRVYVEGIDHPFKNNSRQHSNNPNEENQSLVYILGIVEEEIRHNFEYSGPKELRESKEVKELLKKLTGKTYNLAYSDGRKKNSHRVHTITLINIDDLTSYRTITKRI